MLPNIRKIFFITSLFFTIGSATYGQCPNFGLTVSYTKDACFGVDDGIASVKLVGGGAGSYMPSNFSLWLRTGFAYTPITATTQIFNGDSIVYSGLTPSDEIFPFSNYVIRFSDISCAGGIVWDIYDSPIERNAEIFANETISPVCSVSDGEIIVAPSGGTGPYSLVWSGGPTAIPDDETNPVGLQSGSYDLLITDAVGCTSNTTIELPEPNATLTLTGPSEICFGSTSTMQVAINDGTGPFTVVIDTTGLGNNRTIVGYNSGSDITIEPDISSTYLLVSVVDFNGCSASLSGSAAITVNTLPPDAANPVDNMYCNGSAPKAISVDDPGAGFRIDWYDASAGGNLVGSGPTFTPASAGTYWAEVVNLSGNCASVNRISATLSETPLPVDATNPTDNFYCAGNPLTMLSVDDPGVGFRIDWYDANVAGNLVGSGPTFTPALAGTYWAEVVDESTLCVSASRIAAVLTENAKPAPILISGEASPLCQAAGEVYSVPVVMGSTYLWTVPPGASIIGPNNGASITVDFGFNSGDITVIETNSAGCGGDLSIFSISLQSCPFAADFMSDVNKICVNGTVQFTDASSVPLGTNYSWDFGTDASPATANTVGPHNVTYTSPGIKQVTLTVDNGALNNSISKFITVTDVPMATLSGDSSICPGSTVPLQVDLTGTAPWTFTYSDGISTFNEIVNASPYVTDVNPTANTTYVPISVVDSLCSGNVFGSAQVDMLPPKEVTFRLDSIVGTAGTTVKVPIRLIGYEDLMTMQFTVEWDANLLNYSQVSDIALGNVSSTNFSTDDIAAGYLTFSWNTASLGDTTIADSAAIFSVEFELMNTVCSDAYVSIDETAGALTKIEMADENFCIANVTVIGGNVENQVNPQVSSSDNDICFGDPVVFSAAPAGMSNYQFYLNGVEVQNGSNNVFLIDTLINLDSVNVIINDAFSCSIPAQGIITSVEQLIISSTVSQISACGLSDGTISLSVTGGSGTYLYNWSGPDISDPTLQNQSGLGWGLYTVVVTDDLSGCSESLDINIIEPANFSLAATTSDVTSTGGNDGSIDLTITGGTGPFSILWSGPNDFTSTDEDISNLFAGSYTVEVTDLGEGCTSFLSVDILQPLDAIVLNAIQTDVTTCGAMDGTINLIIMGGSGSFSVSWTGPESFTGNSQNLSGLGPGLYIATVVDLSTTLTAQWSVVIDEPEGFAISAVATDISYCSSADGTIALDMTGGSGDFSYIWKDLVGLGFNSTDKDLINLGLGIYRVTVTDNVSGCIDSTDATVSRPAICDQPCSLNVESTTNNTSCPDTQDGVAVINIISGGSATGSYYVSLDTGQTYLPFQGQDITSITNQGQGSYLYIVMDSVTGCQDTTIANVGVSTNLMANISVNNPGCDGDNGNISFNVSGGLIPFEVDLIDSLGNTSSMSGSGFIQFSNLTAGSYHYEIREQSGCSIMASDSIELTIDCFSGCTSLVATLVEYENATCDSNGYGKAIFEVTGGSNPYEYTVDGSNWIPFISGNTVDRLPADGTYNVVIRQDSLNPGCSVDVSVTIGGPQPMTLAGPIITTTKASCNQNDGAVKISEVIGGTPAYTYQIDGAFISLPSDSIVGGLSAGAHILSVIDATNCQTDFNFNVDAEGLIVATITDVPVSCTTVFLKAGVRVEIDLNATSVPGPYEVYLATASDPENGSYHQVPDNGVRTILNLDKDIYVVNVTTVSGLGCSQFETVPVLSGLAPVDFDIIDRDSIASCVGDQGSITIGNVTGDPDSIITVQLFNESNDLLETYMHTLNELDGGFTIDGSNTDKLVAGTYYVKIRQNQVGCTGIEVNSELIRIYEPLAQLGFEIVEEEASLTDNPTGYAVGEVLASGGDPYEALIQLVEPAFEMNINNIIEFNESKRWTKALNTGDNLNKWLIRFDTLWAGLYEITVVDDYGCEYVMEHSINFDEDIFIPNVFTPNDDGYNDAFYIRNLPDNGTKVVISSRSGSIVFESDNYTYENLWDGGEVADGIYFYNISLPSGEVYKGWVEKWRGSRP